MYWSLLSWRLDLLQLSRALCLWALCSGVLPANSRRLGLSRLPALVPWLRETAGLWTGLLPVLLHENLLKAVSWSSWVLLLFREYNSGASQVAQWWRIRLPVQEMQEMQVQSLGWEDPLEEDMAGECQPWRISAWRIPRAEEEPGGLQSMGPQRVGHDWVHV